MSRWHLPYRVRRPLFAALALALGYAAWNQYGAKGLLLATLMMSFWGLLQFTQLMRLLQTAAQRPLGHVSDAQALHAQLRRDMPLTQVVRLTHSLGRRIEWLDTGDCFEWRDEQGGVVRGHFVRGRLAQWEVRQEAPAEQPPAPT
jgi:hypothetical protein